MYFYSYILLSNDAIKLLLFRTISVKVSIFFIQTQKYVKNIDSVIDTTVMIQPCITILCQLILNGMRNL